MAAPKKKVAKKKVKVSVPVGRVCISAGLNNTIVSITDLDGKVISWSTSGAAGFRGSKKATPYAAQRASEIAVDGAKAYGLEKVYVFIKGIGSGREQAVRGLHLSGLDILSIVDRTPTPHGGCRKKNPRKV